MDSMNTRLNIEKLDGNIVQKHRGSKQVGFKQLGHKQVGSNNLVLVLKQESMEYMIKSMFSLRWNYRELKRDREAEVFEVSNDDTALAQRRLKDKQPEEKTNTDCLLKEQEKENIRLGGRSRRSSLSKVLWVEDTTMSTYLVNRSPSSAIGFKTPELLLYRNMSFNESRKYKKTFIGSGVGTGSVQVLQGVEFEVEPEQHSAWELFSYREDNNEAAFAVAAVDKIYAHESLTFNNTVACEVISKWKVGLKDDMDARSDVYALSNGCKKCSDDSYVYSWEYTPAKGNVLGMEIVRDQSGNTLRMSQSRLYNGKLVQTLLEGHFILSLEGSLSGDCDVEKNGKWSCIYAVGSQEYQMVCTRLDIASVDVGMLDKFDRGLQIHVQVFVDLDYAMVAYMTLTEAAKEAIWLKGLAIESGFELKIVAGIATGALSKAIPSPRFQHRLNLLSIGIG
ncbi:hypothetical protein Tco_0305250 [Tanacetum coccineum]